MDIAISRQRICKEAVNHFLATCILYPSHFYSVSRLKNSPVGRRWEQSKKKRIYRMERDGRIRNSHKNFIFIKKSLVFCNKYKDCFVSSPDISGKENRARDVRNQVCFIRKILGVRYIFYGVKVTTNQTSKISCLMPFKAAVAGKYLSVNLRCNDGKERHTNM